MKNKQYGKIDYKKTEAGKSFSADCSLNNKLIYFYKESESTYLDHQKSLLINHKVISNAKNKVVIRNLTPENLKAEQKTNITETVNSELETNKPEVIKNKYKPLACISRKVQ